MPNTEAQDLPAASEIVLTDGLYLVQDPTGTPQSTFATLQELTGLFASVGGASFPDIPSDGDRFYRTDRKIEYYWNETVGAWLSTQLFQLPITGASQSVVTSDASFRLAVPFKDLYSIYLEHLEVAMWRSSAGEWDIAFHWEGVGAGAGLLASIDGAGTTTSVWSNHSATINAILTADARAFLMIVDEISGTSSVFASGILTYRLVG